MTINSQSIFTSSFHSEKTSDCQMKKLNKNKKTCLEVLAWQMLHEGYIENLSTSTKKQNKCIHYLGVTSS